MSNPPRVAAAPPATPTLSKVKDNHPVDNHSAAANETAARPAGQGSPKSDLLRPLSTRVPQELHDRLDYAVFTKQFASRQEAVIEALDQLLPDLPQS